MSGATCIITIGAQWILVVTDVIVWWLWNNIVIQVKICIVNCTPFKCCLMCPLWIFNLENGNICFILFLKKHHAILCLGMCNAVLIIWFWLRSFFFQLYELPGTLAMLAIRILAVKENFYFLEKLENMTKMYR